MKTILTFFAMTFFAMAAYANPNANPNACNVGNASFCTPQNAYNGAGNRNAEQQIAGLPTGQLRDILTELNNEDQRLVSGSYDASTGTLTLYTQDMRAGADGDISRRAVVIEGMGARDGQDGADGRDGQNGSNGADGRDGRDGTNGQDGRDGKDGADGRDGADGQNGRDGTNGADGRDGQDFDAAQHRALLAASTALGGLQYESLSEGEQGWALGTAGQYEGDTAFAIGVNYGVTDTITLYASISSTYDGEGLTGFLGASGKF